MPDANPDLMTRMQRWRDDLRSAEGVSAGEVDELEDHLRAEIDRLRGAGLNDREAFAVAVMRVGESTELDEQYAACHVGRVWRRRVMWMIGGYLVIHMWVMAMQSVLAPLLTNSVGLMEMPPAMGYPLMVGAWLIAIALLVTLMYRLSVRGTTLTAPRWSWWGGVTVVAGVATGYLLIATFGAVLSIQFQDIWVRGLLDDFASDVPDFWTWRYFLYIWLPQLQHLIPLTLLALAGVLAWRGLSERRAMG
ncbi:MAG: hypothetical protein AAGB29_14220 [Planctomycetota bacterium]